MRGIQGTANKTYRQLIGNGLRYEIPKFQRDYTWEKEQWDDLWQDIMMLLSDEETEHYMGYLVLQTSDNKDFTVIDGQQRLTTISIITLSVLKCLDNLIQSGINVEQNTKRKDNLQKSYIGYVNPVTLISSNKLKLNRNSDDYYRNYMVLLRDLPIRNTNTSEKHMRECFQWYFDKVNLKYKSGEELAQFVEDIVDALFFTVIEVTDQLNAFKVFETLNARGVQLSSADLLKNYLFSVVDETNPPVTEIEELENLWASIVGKLGNQKIDDYLRYFWNSYNKSIGKKYLFKEIKKHVTTKQQVFNLVRELLNTADLYLAIQNPDDEFWHEFPEIKEPLRELKLFQIRQVRSLFLTGYRLLPKEKFLKLAKACSVISFRYNVIGGSNPNIQEEIYNSTALNIIKTGKLVIEGLRPIYITDKSFENDFSTKSFKYNTRNHKIVKYILSKIELYKFSNSIDYDNDFYTIEHILPESAEESWGEFSQEEIKRSRFRLGNLALLEKKINREAGNLSYKEKIPFYLKSNSLLTKAVPENFEIWNELKISSRQRELAKVAKGIWRIQELV